MRQFTWGASLDYIVNGSGQLETRTAQLRFNTEFENSDRLNLDVQQNYELLIEPFNISSDAIIPIGAYGFRDAYVSYYLGPQRRVSEALSL